MLTILVRMKILTDALASVASVWIRAWYDVYNIYIVLLIAINIICVVYIQNI